MKKFILILGLIIATQIQTKAQQEKQFITATHYRTSKATVLTQDNSFSKSMYSSANYLPVKDYDYYMNKRRKNLTGGLVTLGGGLLFSGVGLLMASSSSSDEETGISGGVLTGIGAIAGIVSIPFMIMAEVYKHKAKVKLSSQKTGFGLPLKVGKSITGITMSIPIGK
jgi:hypothetical protein